MKKKDVNKINKEITKETSFPELKNASDAIQRFDKLLEEMNSAAINHVAIEDFLKIGKEMDLVLEEIELGCLNQIELQNKLNKHIKKVNKKVCIILNKGVVRDGNGIDIRKTLEIHENIKILLEEMDYTLSKDIPFSDALRKVTNIENELNLIIKKIEED